MQGILYKALEKSVESLATSMQLAGFKKKKKSVSLKTHPTLQWLSKQREHVASYNLDCK